MNIEENKNILKTHLKKIDREGIKDLLVFLEKSDFYIAPCSTKYHLNIPGGLVYHSLNVFKLFKEKVERYKLELGFESIVICSLLHDICKVNFYKLNKEKNEKEPYVIDDQFPLGHGEKSVILLQKFINLTNKEIMIIRWHMSGFGDCLYNSYHGRSYYKSIKICPEIIALFCADYEATVLLES